MTDVRKTAMPPALCSGFLSLLALICAALAGTHKQQHTNCTEEEKKAFIFLDHASIIFGLTPTFPFGCLSHTASPVSASNRRLKQGPPDEEFGVSEIQWDGVQ